MPSRSRAARLTNSDAGNCGERPSLADTLGAVHTHSRRLFQFGRRNGASMTKLQKSFCDLRTIDAEMYDKMNERMMLAAEYGYLRRLRAEAESQLQNAG